MYSYEIRKKRIWKVGHNKQEEVECIFVALLYNNWYVRTLDYSSPQHTLIPNVYTFIPLVEARVCSFFICYANVQNLPVLIELFF